MSAARSIPLKPLKSDDASDFVIRLKPYHYMHVLDNNTNTTRVELGPQVYTRQDHESIVTRPVEMVLIPPRHLVMVANPVVRDADGAPTFDEHGQAKLRHGDTEMRFEQRPFALFPGEELASKVTPLTTLRPNCALRLRCLRDFDEADGGASRLAGDEWLFEGSTYYPRVEVEVVEQLSASIVSANQALKLRARRACVDRKSVARKAGEEWLVHEVGAYMPLVDEEVLGFVEAVILTETQALHLRANRTFQDKYGTTRKAGEEWLVTNALTEAHVPDVFEDVVGIVEIVTLSAWQYVVLLDPIGDDGKPQLGKREVRKGECSFFLAPGESLERGIQDSYVLGEDEALLLRATESFAEGEVAHTAGDRWMIYGPQSYIPSVEVEIIEKRRAIPLDENEGIYVRNILDGKVRAEVGPSAYMLKSTEELWEKDLPQMVEDLLARELLSGNPRSGSHRPVACFSRAPPCRLFLTVETSDHARLELQLSYNWHFEVDKTNAADAARIFQVPDFVGDTCKAIASRVRGAVASESFDNFHKNSAAIIRTAVFGRDKETSKIRDRFAFDANKLVVTNIDVQAVEPVDHKTRESLQKSVQLAIGITTQSQEAAAQHEAQKNEQESRGRHERQKISDEAQAEGARKQLLQLQAESAAVESAGAAKAEARARSEAATIEGNAAVEMARLRAEAARIETQAELEQLRASQEAELEHMRALDELEIEKAKQLAAIESDKFKKAVKAIGSDTITAIATAGPATQAKMLQGLGIQSMLITDGSSPINLFNTANGLIGAGGAGGAAPQ